MAHSDIKYPWSDIVRFHQDIVQLEQDNFFKLTPSKSGTLDGPHSSLLSNYIPTQLTGPWEIPPESFSSPLIVEDIKTGKITEGFFGGPCWSGSQKIYPEKTWTPFLSPLLYQQVRVEYDETEDQIILIPAEGRWDFSPLVHDEIGRREFEPVTPLEELSFTIIEQAHSEDRNNNNTLTGRIIHNTGEYLPFFHELFEKISDIPSLAGKQNPWVFFLAPNPKNSFSKYIMPDYDQILQILDEDHSQIGGFRIFEGRSDSIEEIHSPTLYPLTSMNSSQNKAVQGILDAKPLTVISGPPGCGKSQVVVSLLLNAWSNGKSVLFASNTKAAVDVVYDRLLEYESDYPIAVRAGSKDRNTFEDAYSKLRHYTQIQGLNAPERTQIENEIATISSQKIENQKFLDAKIPQKITQAKQTAQKAFVEHLRVKSEIEDYSAPYVDKIRILGYHTITPDDFESTVLSPLSIWLHDIDSVNCSIHRDEEQKREYIHKRDSYKKSRDRCLVQFGYHINPHENPEWLITGTNSKEMRTWLHDLSAYVSADIEQHYGTTVLPEHCKWKTSSGAATWIEQARKLEEQITGFIQTYTTVYEQFCAISGKVDSLTSETEKNGINADNPLLENAISEWRELYSRYLSTPRGITTILKRKKLEKHLSQSEEALLTTYSPTLWKHIAQNSESGREELFNAIDLTQRWISAKKAKDYFEKKRDIETELTRIQDLAINVGITISPRKLPELLELRAIPEQISKTISVAANAKKSLEDEVNRQQTSDAINRYYQRYQSFAANTPLLKNWEDGKGRELLTAIQTIHGTPEDRDAIRCIRNSVNDTRHEIFFSEWDAAIHNQAEFEEYESLIQTVPDEDRHIAEWWNRIPEHCTVQKIDHSSLPEKTDVLHEHLQECSDFVDLWNEFVEETLSDMRTEVRLKKERAYENFRRVYEMIPEGMRSEDIQRIFDRILLNSDKEVFLSEEDEAAFNVFNPERVSAKIRDINTRLTELSFNLSNDNYQKRIENGSYVLEDVDELRYHFRKNYNKAKGFPREKYTNVLNALPIWITNAHQCQSFPLEPDIFDVLVIDEASQCTLTNILPFIYRAKSVAVIGDPEQLPAIIKINEGKESAIAARYGVEEYCKILGHSENTMFDTGLKFLPGGRKNVINLVEHYRSHPLIIGFSNLYIYQMKLSLKRGTLRSASPFVQGIFGIDIRGECRKTNSWSNHREAQEIVRLIADIRSNDAFYNKSIGVVTPFRGQVNAIQHLLEERSIPGETIEVGTVDTFQGNERDIMIFSPVISKGMNPRTAQWSDDKNRINVALTRARDLMIVVGDFDYCRKMDTLLGKLIEYVETVAILRNTSMEELELFSLMIMEGEGLGISSTNLPKIHRRIGDIEVDFVLSNPKNGAKLVIEVDGKQHYYVEINGEKHTIGYHGLSRFVEYDGHKSEIYRRAGKEFVDIESSTYEVNQTRESITDDTIRDGFLRAEGYKIFRIPASDIREKPDVVISDIRSALEIGE